VMGGRDDGLLGGKGTQRGSSVKENKKKKKRGKNGIISGCYMTMRCNTRRTQMQAQTQKQTLIQNKYNSHPCTTTATVQLTERPFFRMFFFLLFVSNSNNGSNRVIGQTKAQILVWLCPMDW